MIQRDVFSTDQYVDHFKPDQEQNPFHGIYTAKRADVLRTVRESLPGGGSILDLGGGMGRMAVPLAQHYDVTLCDLSAEMLRLAEVAGRETGVFPDRLSTRRLNAAEALPFPSATFDQAVSVDLLVHLPDPTAALRELHRVLKPSGELLVDVTNRAPLWLLRYPRYLGRQPNRWLQTWRGGGVLPEWQSIVRHYTRAEFLSMLDAAGFITIQEWSYGPRWCPKWFLARCRPR